MRILVVGAYGLIGAAIVERLIDAGHAVTAVGRDVRAARRREPRAEWVPADISRLVYPADWRALVSGADAVVNASGALQDGARDRLGAVQVTAMIALYDAAAAASVGCVVTISAPGARYDASTAFMRTKAEADAHLRSLGLGWVVLRPGLVISARAYGATALIRALAGFPGLMPIVTGAGPIQTVADSDVADAVLAVISGEVARCGDYDLVEAESHSLGDIVATFRARLGKPKAPVVTLPAYLARPIFAVADLLGWLGWRSPLRSTAYKELARGVTGDPLPWIAAGGQPMRPLVETLRHLPASVQERWFAGSWLVKPAILGVLVLFWTISGLIGLAQMPQAVAVLTERGVDAGWAGGLVAAGSWLDLALGFFALWHGTARLALKGMVAATLAYLAIGTLLAPDLWLDPLGAYVKTLPAVVLAMAGLAVLDER